jgi:uncharacterized membrane protein YeiB
MTFWTWLVYAVLGLLTLSLINPKDRAVLIFIILLGGIFYLEHQKSGGLTDLINQLEGK